MSASALMRSARGMAFHNGEPIGVVTNVEFERHSVITPAYRFITNQEAAVPEPRNPYDRRERPATNASDSHTWMSFTGPVSPPTTFAIEEINAIVASAYERGCRDTSDERDVKEAGVRQETCRAAWDEGYQFGLNSGRDTMVRELGERYEVQVRRVHNEGKGVLNQVGTNPRSVSKRELELVLAATVDMLAELMHAQHNGFPDPDAF